MADPDEANVADEAGRPDPHQDAEERAGHILVVDDDRINRLTCARAVERQGHTVTTVTDGRQALALLRDQDVDAVLLDIVMPEMDGYEVLEAMKGDQQLREVPVIVVSAVEELDSVVRCIEMGAEDYLTKPFNAVLLRARLQASLRKKRMRDLERAYLRQEMMLRQSEKLATLGRLSAGMAHELNNPAAAAQRGASQLAAAAERFRQLALALAAARVEAEHVERFAQLAAEAEATARAGEPLDPLERSGREDALGQLLTQLGSDEPWQDAAVLAGAGYTRETVQQLLAPLPQTLRPVAAGWLAVCTGLHILLREIRAGTGRIAELVRALQDYSYMDQAPVQDVDVHEGLENTLVILRNRLKDGIEVVRDYDESLPSITAFGSELNQVWTNLIDNAVDVMADGGTLTLRTRHKDGWVEVEVQDTGPGIPPGAMPHIFDPFFTTKEPGQGTGLGLNISHNIITDRHGGEIQVNSDAGGARFRVRLPVNGPLPPAPEAAASQGEAGG